MISVRSIPSSRRGRCTGVFVLLTIMLACPCASHQSQDDPPLAAVEPALLPVLPLTAGQLASFANDGVARKHPRTDPFQDSLKTVDSMLATLAR